MGPGGFVPTNPDLADILFRTYFDFENFIFLIFLGPSFLAWAQLGPTHLGPAWAHPRGPGLGPPTWAQLGPTHLGPAWAHPLGPSLGPPTWAQLGPTHLGPDAAGAGRILKSRSRPLPTHPGMKYFRKETLAVDLTRSSGPRFARPSYLFGLFLDFYKLFWGQEGFRNDPGFVLF